MRVLRFALWVATILGAPAVARSGDEPEPAEWLSLTLTSSTSEIVVCEPLLVSVRLTNRTSESHQFHENFFNDLEFLSSYDGDAFSVCAFGKGRGWSISDVGGYLAPADSETRGELLFFRRARDFDGEAFVFSQPGKYRIKARTYTMESNVVDLTVRPPTPDEKRAIAAFSEPLVAGYMQGYATYQPGTREQAIARLKRLVTEHPKSPFADYANYRLGGALRPDEWSKDPKRVDSAREAYRYLDAVSHRIPALRLRAAYAQAYMLEWEPAVRAHADFYRIKKDLSTPEAQALLADRAREIPWVRWVVPALEIQFVKDERFDRKIHYRCEKGSTYGDILKALSDQTGVRLDAGPARKASKIVLTGEITGTLREFMWKEARSNYDRYWERRGDGWFLVVEPPAEPPKPPKPVPQGKDKAQGIPGTHN